MHYTIIQALLLVICFLKILIQSILVEFHDHLPSKFYSKSILLSKPSEIIQHLTTGIESPSTDAVQMYWSLNGKQSCWLGILKAAPIHLEGIWLRKVTIRAFILCLSLMKVWISSSTDLLYRAGSNAKSFHAITKGLTMTWHILPRPDSLRRWYDPFRDLSNQVVRTQGHGEDVINVIWKSPMAFRGTTSHWL